MADMSTKYSLRASLRFSLSVCSYYVQTATACMVKYMLKVICSTMYLLEMCHK